MRVHPPEVADHLNRELAMFCEEGRLTRELFWVGFGFQIWCQLLTHLTRAANSSLFVVDEPETYLHPDVQRQLVGLVREVGVPVLLATHSTEIISEADPNDLVYIDKARATGERLKSVASIQTSLEKMGSGLNITLTALARSRKVVFVEGESDYKILRCFASRLGLHELSAGVGLTMLPSGGFGSWRRVTTLANGISDVLGAPLTIAAVYDRDYFCNEEATRVKLELSEALSLAHVHNRKEIENYLLVPSALSRAIERATRSKQQPISACYPEEAIRLILHELTEAKKQDIQSQFVAKRIDYLRSSRRDTATLAAETMKIFEERWSSLDTRLEIVPGKEILADLRAIIQQKSGISLSHSMIIESTHRDEVPEDLVSLIRSLDQFRSSPTPGLDD